MGFIHQLGLAHSPLIPVLLQDTEVWQGNTTWRFTPGLIWFSPHLLQSAVLKNAWCIHSVKSCGTLSHSRQDCVVLSPLPSALWLTHFARHTHFSVCLQHIQLKHIHLDLLNEKPIQFKNSRVREDFFFFFLLLIKTQRQSEADPSEDNIHAKFQQLPLCSKFNGGKITAWCDLLKYKNVNKMEVSCPLVHLLLLNKQVTQVVNHHCSTCFML